MSSTTTCFVGYKNFKVLGCEKSNNQNNNPESKFRYKTVRPALRHTASSDRRHVSNPGMISLNLSSYYWYESLSYISSQIGQTGTGSQEQTNSSKKTQNKLGTGSERAKLRTTLEFEQDIYFQFVGIHNFKNSSTNPSANVSNHIRHVQVLIIRKKHNIGKRENVLGNNMLRGLQELESSWMRKIEQPK
ncbi:hypothetical protein CEXT_364381 [Caerostris extrusa]|uniref:Uncharacterized protein n=1 Tax=Caerostris extrusa TaxID=172846 RepID=A0AAV4M762_CAEEX|nr:hypothetical protein CEXT_364381 [Caerostris extrusa]